MHSQISGIKAFIPWIIILILLALFDFMKVLPVTMKWIEAQTQSNTITQEIENLTILLKENEDKDANIQAQFDTEAKDFIVEESQIFPKTFSAYDVSKIFELFSIQYSLLDAESRLRIDKLSFSGSDKGKVRVNLEMMCTEATLKQVIEYLQSGELPKDLIDTDTVGLDPIDIAYLQSHKLPIAHIQSIRVSKGETLDGVDLKRIALEVSFFVQR